MSEPNDYNPSSPAGQIEQAAAFAGRMTRLRGWRREVARWGVVVLLMIPIVMVVVSELTR